MQFTYSIGKGKRVGLARSRPHLPTNPLLSPTTHKHIHTHHTHTSPHKTHPEGYDVYVVTDASGTFSAPVRDAALTRATAAGAVLINWFAVACELQKDWRLGPNAGQGLASLLGSYLPEYGNLITSHAAASKAT